MEKNPPEVSEIREYRPGDRMHNIHWKLSAKRDEIMVYEFISEQNIMPVIYLAIGKRYRTASCLYHIFVFTIH